MHKRKPFSAIQSTGDSASAIITFPECGMQALLQPALAFNESPDILFINLHSETTGNGTMLPFFFILITMLQTSTAAGNSTDQLPELDVFLRDVRANLQSDRLLQNRYTYNMKQTRIRLDGEGNPKESEVDEFMVFPSLDEKYTYRKQIVKDGKPVDPEEIDKQDRSHMKKLKKQEEELSKEGLDEKTRRLQREAEEKQKEDRIIDELFRMYEFSLVRRDRIDGYPAILLKFRPRPDFKPSSKEAKILFKLAGLAWICEEDHQLMRADIEFIDNVSFGKGLLARLHKGTKASIRRKRINDEIWLPAKADVEGSVRILLVKKIRFRTINEYSDYRKYVVDAAVDFHASENEPKSIR